MIKMTVDTGLLCVLCLLMIEPVLYKLSFFLENVSSFLIWSASCTGILILLIGMHRRNFLCVTGMKHPC
jgi:hypothetical protein